MEPKMKKQLVCLGPVGPVGTVGLWASIHKIRPKPMDNYWFGWSSPA